LYSGPPAGLGKVEASKTAQYLFGERDLPQSSRRPPVNWLKLQNVTLNNLHELSVRIPIGLFTAITGVSGSGKSSLVSQALVEMVAAQLGHEPPQVQEAQEVGVDLETVVPGITSGHIDGGMEFIKRLVNVDQKPIGRTPRSNLATYTGLFDHVRRLFAATPAAKARRYDAGRFSFNMPKGRCATCEGEGFVSVELLFMPSVYAPCPTCHGARYNHDTLKVTYSGRNIAEVLGMTVREAREFFVNEPSVFRSLQLLQDIGLGYLRLGQPATELSGGEAQRSKLATELQRSQRGDTLYILDEPTTGLHAADVDKLMMQLNTLIDAGNTVVVVEHDMRVVAASDWVIDMGPGDHDGGRIVASGTPGEIAKNATSRTARYLLR
jgi:excinuclease ABC subunit A